MNVVLHERTRRARAKSANVVMCCKERRAKGAQTMTSNEQTLQIKILIVDDHPVLREGLAAMITNDPGMTLVAEAGTGAEGIDLFQVHRPDVTIMDLRLPDMSGIDAIVQIRGSYPNARIIVLTTYLGDVQASRALKAGAHAFLLKAGLRTELLDTIRAV